MKKIPTHQCLILTACMRLESICHRKTFLFPFSGSEKMLKTGIVETNEFVDNDAM